MTQSAASQHMRSLEQALGTPLVERVGGTVVPTRAGEGLLRYGREMLRVASEAERYVASLRDAKGGRLALGACGSAVYLVSPLVAAFREAHPEVDVRLDVLTREAVREGLLAGTLDVAIIGSAARDDALTISPLCPDRILPVVSPSSALLPASALGQLSLARIVEQGIVAPASATATWQLVESQAQARGVTLRPAHRLEGIEAVKKAVEAGLGVAFLSCWTIERELALGTLRAVRMDGWPLMRRFDLVRHGTRHVDGVLEAFLAFAPPYLAKRLPPLVAEKLAEAAEAAGSRSVA